VARPSRREHVVASGELLRAARLRFPPGGSVDGTPRFEQFVDGPLAAVIEYFSRDFDGAPEAAAGVKVYVTVGSFFPAMLFYAMRISDHAGGDHIEVVSFVPDDDYWDVIGDDPED
jgi:hypothetical protein